jgi:hypothetical protein
MTLPPARGRVLGLLLTMVAAGGTAAPAASQDSAALTDFLLEQGKPPAEYVISKFARHRVVLLGEHHWLRHDVELVRQLIPLLPGAGVTILAVEMFPAVMQDNIDYLVQTEDWDELTALAVLRAAEWPYREYGELIRETWALNRRLSASGRPLLRLLGIGPTDEGDWRGALMGRGLDADSFMARRILDSLGRGRVLVYLGLHHAFTRYHQPETMLDGSVRATIERTGNIIRRELGDRVFMISLHKPWSCGVGDDLVPCLPLDGAIDCAAEPVGRAVAFDVAASPFASIRLQAETYYALAGPMLRLVDFADGYIWTMPIRDYRSVELIPLDTYAPDDSWLDYVMQHNPFGPSASSVLELREIWRDAQEKSQRMIESRGWTSLVARTAACPR